MPEEVCMKVTPEHPVRTVAIVGGTHGNEFSGIYLERRYRAELNAGGKSVVIGRHRPPPLRQFASAADKRKPGR